MDPQNRSLTIRYIDSIKPPQLPIRRIEYPDGVVEGLRLRVTFRGVKSWTLRYRVGTRRPQLKLGRYPRVTLEKARRRARIALAKVDQGRDPAAERKAKLKAPHPMPAECLTLARFKPAYLDFAKLTKRSWPEDERRYDNKFIPWWGDVPLKDLTRKMIADRLAVVAANTPVEANRLKSLITKVLNVAVDRGEIENHPATRMKKPGGDEAGRERVLTEHEIRVCWDSVATAESAFWTEASEDADAITMLHPHFASWVRLRLFTLQRGSEIIEMRWPDIELDTRWWTIPAKYTKNKLVHRVPLSDLAIEELHRLRAGVPRHECVFPNDRLTGSRKHRLKRFSLAEITGIEDIVPRDLRRTGSTNLGRLKVPEIHIDKLLNHMEGGPRSRKIYNRYEDDAEKRAAMEVWTTELRRVLGERLPSGLSAPIQPLELIA
jgi:integrase